MNPRTWIRHHCTVALLLIAMTARVIEAQQATSNAVDKDALEAIVRLVIPDYARVCDVIQLSVEPGQPPTILASINGSRFCNWIARIQSSGQPTILQDFDAWGVNTLAGVVRDLNQDGQIELVIPQAFSSYEGAECMAIVPVVYKCSATACVDSSSQFPDFYRQELARIQETIASQSVNPERRDGVVCSVMSRDKIMRILGSDRAGFEQAAEWMKSPDPRLRRKAVRVFADIDDAQSLQQLDELSSDADPTVSGFARREKESKGKR